MTLLILSQIDVTVEDSKPKTSADNREFTAEVTSELIVDIKVISSTRINEKIAEIIWLSVTADANTPSETNKQVNAK